MACGPRDWLDVWWFHDKQRALSKTVLVDPNVYHIPKGRGRRALRQGRTAETRFYLATFRAHAALCMRQATTAVDPRPPETADCSACPLLLLSSGIHLPLTDITPSCARRGTSPRDGAFPDGRSLSSVVLLVFSSLPLAEGLWIDLRRWTPSKGLS